MFSKAVTANPSLDPLSSISLGNVDQDFPGEDFGEHGELLVLKDDIFSMIWMLKQDLRHKYSGKEEVGVVDEIDTEEEQF